MDEKCRSTTPPAPPPEPSEILLTSQHAHAQHEPPPPGAQREAQEATGEGMEHETQLQEPRMDLSRQSKLPRPANSKTPELPRAIQISSHQMNGHGYSGSLSHAAHLAPERSRTPDTPGAGSLSPFDWDDLEARFEKALASANEHEDGLMGEFESLVRVNHRMPTWLVFWQDSCMVR